VFLIILVYIYSCMYKFWGLFSLIFKFVNVHEKKGVTLWKTRFDIFELLNLLQYKFFDLFGKQSVYNILEFFQFWSLSKGIKRKELHWYRKLYLKIKFLNNQFIFLQLKNILIFKIFINFQKDLFLIFSFFNFFQVFNPKNETIFFQDVCIIIFLHP